MGVEGLEVGVFSDDDEPIFIGGVGEGSGGNGVVVDGVAAPVVDIAALDQVLLEVD